MSDKNQTKEQLIAHSVALQRQVDQLEQIITNQNREINLLRAQLASSNPEAVDEMIENDTLESYRKHFETLVAERTTKLVTANENLLRQIVEREWAEEELRKITERYRQAVKAGKVGVWDWDLWSQEFYFDPMLQTMLGVEDRKITNLEEWISHVHPEDAERVKTMVNAHFEGGASNFELEHRMVHQDGTTRWFLVRGSTLREDNDRPYRLIGTHTDITEYKQAEEALRLAHNELSKKAADLETANKELAQYAYVVSHDLKAPLRAIHNYADFLNEDLVEMLTSDQGDYLVGLLEAVHEAETLVDDLLELSRIGSQSVSAEIIDLKTFLQDLIAALDVPDDVRFDMVQTWPTLEAEAPLLRQIFQNLIQNGLKFNQSSPKRIELGWSRIGDAYEFSVQDNGIGIKEAYQKRIFNVFQRLHTNDEYPGTGIGLAIVKKAVEKLQGTVRMESKTGQGSTFYVTLPSRQSEA